MVLKFLDPKNDVAFKKIFGTEKNKDILIHFLNDMIVFKNQKPIVDITFLKASQDPEISSQKSSIVDVLCKDATGVNYIVEMQVAKEKGFEKRAQYYAAKAYGSQLLVGGKYCDLKEVIFLAISSETLFPDKKNYKSDHVILDKETYEHDLADFSFTFVELSKFHKTLDELQTMEEKWTYFFKHAEETGEEDLKKLIGSDLIIQKAYTALDRFFWNEEELRTYEQAEKRVHDYLASMEQKYDEGKIEGEAIGIAKGKTEMAREIARELRKNGVAISLIAIGSGLSEEEINSL
jgi:predicted transposase/invertase (TIGR01784 family)